MIGEIIIAVNYIDMRLLTANGTRHPVNGINYSVLKPNGRKSSVSGIFLYHLTEILPWKLWGQVTTITIAATNSALAACGAHHYRNKRALASISITR